MKRNIPIAINLIGGPGIGKSTIAAGIFYNLKKLGISCELVSEFAKDKVWEESFRVLDDQLYLFAKQYHKMWRLIGKVDVIITDSPLLLSIYYKKDKSKIFDDLVVEQYNKFENLTIVLERTPGEYQDEGRIQTVGEAVEIDNEIDDILNRYKIPCVKIEREFAIQYILDTLKSEYKELFESEGD